MLLAGLAVLQYRWVGELSDFEYLHMQRTLRASTEGFRREFARELRRIESVFQVRSRDAEREIAREYGEWTESADFPELMASMAAQEATSRERSTIAADVFDVQFTRLLIFRVKGIPDPKAS
jgi:hypothetical protein